LCTETEEQIDFKHLQGLGGTGVSAVWELWTWCWESERENET